MAATLDTIRDELRESRAQAREAMSQEKVNNADLRRALDAQTDKETEVAQELQDQLKSSDDKLAGLAKDIGVANARLPMDLFESFTNALQGFLGIDFMEKFGKIASGVKSVGDSIVKKLDSMVVSPVKGLLDGFFSAIKFGIALIGGVLGLQAFLDGWNNASKWFGKNADWGDKLAAGLASIAQTFLGLSDEQAGTLAKNIGAFVDRIQNLGAAFFNMIGVLTGLKEGDKVQTLKDFAANLLENWDIILGAALLFKPGMTINLAMKGLKIGFGLMQSGLSAISGILGGGAIGIVGAIAAIVVIANAVYNAVQTFMEKFEETGSFMTALQHAFAEFMGQLIGWPVKLGADLINWVANLLGFEDIIGDFDPVTAIKNFYLDLTNKVINFGTQLIAQAGEIGSFFYNPEEGTVLGINWGQLLTDVKQGFIGTYDYVMNSINSIGKFFYNSETGEVFGINFGQLFTDMKNTVINTAMSLPNEIDALFSNVFASIQNAFIDVANSVIETINKNSLGLVNLEKFDRVEPQAPAAAQAIAAAGQPNADTIGAMDENARIAQDQRVLARDAAVNNAAGGSGGQVNFAPVRVTNTMNNHNAQPLRILTT